MFTAEAAALGNCAERAPALERVERGAVTTSTASEDGVVEKQEHDNHNTLVSVHESNRSETHRDEHHEDPHSYSNMVPGASRDTAVSGRCDVASAEADRP